MFSSFVTLAAFLALAVELQHGGRVAMLADRPEPCAVIFLFLGLTASVIALPNRLSVIKRFVNLLVLTRAERHPV